MNMEFLLNRTRQVLLSFLLVCLTGIPVHAGPDENAEADELIGLSLEELLQMTVTSVSRKPRALSTSPAAIFVISQDDIQRSGARTIPDLLRMVPGIQVAQVDANTWAVTARGSNGVFANKLLVLMDGRSIYGPLFSGVYWDTQDTDLASIERIEVIRGPGAALWGANAVNGVINIITANAAETKGFSANLSTSSVSSVDSTIRYGGSLSEKVNYRIYAKYFDREGFSDLAGSEEFDEWHGSRIGARIDYAPTDDDALTLTTEYYDTHVGENVLENSTVPPTSQSRNLKNRPQGGFVNFGWNRALSETSNLQLKLFYERSERNNLAPEEKRDTYDLDFQHNFVLGSRHDVVWGLGVRNSEDSTNGSQTISYTPASRTQRLYSGFVQDEIRLIGEELFVTLGTKFEKNNFSPDNSFEFSPNLRLSWALGESSTLWGSVGRAIRTPSRTERDARILGSISPPFTGQNTFPVPFALTIVGNPSMDNEEVIAYEIGYRAQPFESMSFDISVFYNDYENLRAQVDQPIICQPLGLPISNPACFGPVDFFELPIAFENLGKQQTKGIEIAASYNATDWWRMHGAYSYLTFSGASETSAASIGADSPKHQFSLRSLMNIGESLNLDIWARYVDDLKVQNVDSYIGLDMRLAWQPLSIVQLSLVGRNLLDSEHLEFQEEFGSNIAVQIDREFAAEIRLEF